LLNIKTASSKVNWLDRVDAWGLRQTVEVNGGKLFITISFFPGLNRNPEIG